MKKGISYWSLKNGLAGTHSIAAALSDASKAGFEALELCIAPEGVLSVETTQEECAAIRDSVKVSGLAVETVASGMSWDFCPTDLDAKVRRRSIALHKAALQRTAWLGCKSMLYVPGAIAIPWNQDFPRVPYDRAIDWAVAAIKELLPLAEELKVELCVENVWNGLLYSPLEMRDFIDQFDSKWLRCYFDIGNVIGLHQDPADWIRILGKRIGRIHVKDFKRSVGTLEGFCDLGEGDVPWEDVNAALKKIRYQRTLIAEMLPWKRGLLPKTARALQTLFPV